MGRGCIQTPARNATCEPTSKLAPAATVVTTPLLKLSSAPPIALRTIAPLLLSASSSGKVVIPVLASFLMICASIIYAPMIYA
jgi:hypothetical protein